MPRRNWLRTLILAAAGLATAAPAAYAWVHPEHRAIAGATIAGLPPEQAKALSELWAIARVGHEDRLCEQPWAGDQGMNPGCIDLAALAALSGDHSCSAGDLMNSVLNEKWVMDVARVASRLELHLRAAMTPAERISLTRHSDLDFERVDKAYSTRAGANSAHFMLARKNADPLQYLSETVAPGVELNVIGIWLYNHVIAMKLASRAMQPGLSPAEQGDLARKALAAEMYGMHFLQDAFASGHVAGTWGKMPTRKGTHDFYNEQGLAASTWAGRPLVMAGDSHMRPEDVETAAPVARLSLEQFLSAMNPESLEGKTVAALNGPVVQLTGGVETCKATTLPAEAHGSLIKAIEPELLAVLRQTPVPGLGEGLGSLPRYRAEIGPFAGITGGFQLAIANGAFDTSAIPVRANGLLNFGFRTGLGLEALLTERSAAQIFLDVGLTFRASTRSECPLIGCGGDSLTGILPRSPARQGVSTRVRLPFWLIPGDLIVAAPILAFTAPELLKRMAISAANGGAGGVEASFGTPIGRMQFVLGRELGATFYGYATGKDVILIYTPSAGTIVPTEFRSIDWDIPILEYRPFREYATSRSSSLLFQLGIGVDVPNSVAVVPPYTSATPELKKIWSARVRLVFDWKRYF